MAGLNLTDGMSSEIQWELRLAPLIKLVLPSDRNASETPSLRGVLGTSTSVKAMGQILYPKWPGSTSLGCSKENPESVGGEMEAWNTLLPP